MVEQNLDNLQSSSDVELEVPNPTLEEMLAALRAATLATLKSENSKESK